MRLNTRTTTSAVWVPQNTHTHKYIHLSTITTRSSPPSPFLHAHRWARPNSLVTRRDQKTQSSLSCIIKQTQHLRRILHLWKSSNLPIINPMKKATPCRSVSRAMSASWMFRPYCMIWEETSSSVGDHFFDEILHPLGLLHPPCSLQTPKRSSFLAATRASVAVGI